MTGPGMTVQGAIIDCDGTLLESMGEWAHVGIDYIVSLGLEPESDLRAKLQPLSLAQAADYLKDAYALELSPEEIMEGIDGLLEEFYRDRVQLKRGAREFLRRLEESHIAHCVATATDRYLVEAAFERLGIAQLTGRIFTCGEVGSGKDDPRIFETALAWLDTPRETTVVFDDALYVVRTAKAAGFPTVAVWDVSNVEQRDLIGEVADALYVDLREALVMLP